MSQKRRVEEHDVISKMFFSAAIVMIFTQVTGVIATIIDGVITSNFLGEEAYSAVALIGPVTNIVILFATFIATGSQIVCSREIGLGKKDEANAVFSFSVIAGIFLSALLVLFALFFPETLMTICGVSRRARPELHAYMTDYLRGYLIGIPAVIMVQILGPFLVIDGGQKLVSLSAAVLCVSDVAFDLLNALVFRRGILGMAFATSMSLWLQLIVLILFFAKKTGFFRFAPSRLTGKKLWEITRDGLFPFVRKLATILRDILVNRINLMVAFTTAAITAKGIQNDANQLMFCLGLGIGKALLTMTAMYYGANDRNGLRRSFSYAMKFSIIISGVCGAVLFLAAPAVVRIYTDEPEVMSLAVFSVRCMALSLVLDTVSVAYQDYLQGIGSRVIVNVLCFAERFFLPVAAAYVLGMSFGSKGIMASTAVSKLVLVVLVFAYLCIRCKGIPRRWEDYMLLPVDFGGSSEENLDMNVSSWEDVIRLSEETYEFCLAHQVSSKNAGYMSLFVEEMAGNIVTHGEPKSKDGTCLSCRIWAHDGEATLTMRDYCRAFDPLKYFEIHQAENPESMIGIRMVMKLANNIKYINTFNSNCILLHMN